MSSSATRIRRARLVDTVGVLAVVAGLVLGLVPGIADASHGTGAIVNGQFEIDGNLSIDTIGNHDWDDTGDEFEDGTEKSVAGFPESGNGDRTWFQASTVESDYPNWTFTDKGNADKSDLHRLFVGSQVAGDDSYLWLGASRISDNGNTQVTVEFNQNETTFADLGGAYREAGDFWIRFNFPGQQSADNVTVGVSQWPAGKTSGAYPAGQTLPETGFEWDLGGLQSSAETDFIELQLSLSAIFGENGLGLKCSQFGAVSFRTESSGGSDDNNQPTLKDVAGPFPIDLDTCADVEVKKVDEEGEPLNGASFAAFEGHGAPAAGTAAATCITGPDATDVDGASTEGDGECSLGPMLPGDYTLHEVKWDSTDEVWVSGAPDGYEPSPDLPDDFTVVQNTPLDLGPYEDPRIPYTITVEPDGRNAVGNDHEFTVLLEDDSAGVAGETIDLEWSGVGDGITKVVDDGGTTDHDPAVSSTTCTTDGDGKCFVTVTSEQDSGDGDLTATWDTPYQNDVGSAPSNTTAVATNTSSTTPYSDISDSGNKIWVGYVVDIAADGLNLLRDSHDFDVTVWEVDGEGTPDGVLADDVIVTVTWAGPDDSTIDGNAGSTTCTTGTTATGTCTVTVDSDSDAGSGIATVTRVEGWIEAADDQQADEYLVDKTPTAVIDGSLNAEGTAVSDGSLTASKTWVAFRASIDDDSVNNIGDDHDFLVNAEYTTDGSTWKQVPDGSSVTVSDDSAEAGSVGAIDSHTCASTVAVSGHADLDDHVCVVTVTSSESGSLEVTVDGVSATITESELTESFVVTFPAPDATTVTQSGVLEVAGTDDTRDDAFVGTDYVSTKTWAGYELELPPNAVNLLDGSDDDPERYHEVELKLHSTNGQADVAPVGGQDIAVTLVGDGKIDDVSDGTVTSDTTATCTTGAVTPAAGDQTGTCTVTIFSDAAGVGTLSAVYTTMLGDSGQVTVNGDNDPETEGPQPHVKTWTTFQVLVDPLDDQNIVGNWHVFTITVQESDLEGGWDPVVGASHPDDLDFTISGTDLTVSTDGLTTGDPTSEIPYCDSGTDADGKCVIAVKSDTVQAITVKATYTESYAAYNSGTGDAVFTSPEADKEWIDYSLQLSENAENLINTTHTFTVTVGKATAASGGDFLGLPGVTPDVEIVSGPGTVSGGTCVTGVTDASGQCTIELTSSETGLTTVRASYLGENESKTESKQLTDTATKLWVDYQLVLSDDAVNTVGDEHTFTATLSVDTGEGFGPAAGETLAFTFDGIGSVTGGDVDSELECVTATDGTCDIAINSDEPGTSNVGVSYGAVVGETSATYDDDAVKQWIDIDLVKTAVVGDGFGDGDLIEDPETGLPTLFFTSSDQGPKTAVFEYTVTNTGPVALQDVVLTDDRLGTVIALGDGVTLEPGESTTVRASEQYTYQDAAGGLSNIITNVGVVTANDGDGNEVDDTDDAVIQLIAQQSSILIDLVKDVVAGEGDVENLDGVPTVTWSEDEVNANASKTVRYRFTVTNVGPSPIVDVELVDPTISGQPLIAVADGVTLQSGESTVVEVDYQLTAAEAFPDGPTAGEVPNVATVSGANETRDAFDEDVDDAIVFVQVVFAEKLPATGLTSGGLLPLSLLLITVGLGALWLARRRETVR